MPTKFRIQPSERSDDFSSWDGRAILLVDLDAFYASVEQRDHPEWRGVPLIVGGDASRHGVVSTCSYEARAFGVHSAMAASQAARLCPQAIWVPGRHGYYEEVSSQIMSILRDETPLMQQVSIDEAFLEVTNTRVNREHPAVIASRIQRRVKEEIGVTCSVGIGTSKTVAKIASDQDKPFGLTMVEPGRELEFLYPLPIRAMSGIGSSSEQRLIKFGIKTLGDLASADSSIMKDVFGKNADMMRDRAQGRDTSSIVTEREAKSVSSETTFSECISSTEEVRAGIATMASKVGRRLRAKGQVGSTLTLKLRLENRQVKSAQKPLAYPTDDNLEFTPVAYELLSEIWREGIPVRLIGIGLSRIANKDSAKETLVQTSLLDLVDDGSVESVNSGKSPHDAKDNQVDPFSDKEKRENLLAAADAVRNRFGDSSLKFGHEVRNAGNTTGTIPK